MNEKNLKDLVEKQIDNFLYAGEVALDLRNKGLNKEIKSDGTPVSIQMNLTFKELNPIYFEDYLDFEEGDNNGVGF